MHRNRKRTNLEIPRTNTSTDASTPTFHWSANNLAARDLMDCHCDSYSHYRLKGHHSLPWKGKRRLGQRSIIHIIDHRPINPTGVLWTAIMLIWHLHFWAQWNLSLLSLSVLQLQEKHAKHYLNTFRTSLCFFWRAKWIQIQLGPVIVSQEK